MHEEEEEKTSSPMKRTSWARDAEDEEHTRRPASTQLRPASHYAAAARTRMRARMLPTSMHAAAASQHARLCTDVATAGRRHPRGTPPAHTARPTTTRKAAASRQCTPHARKAAPASQHAVRAAAAAR